MHPVHYQAKPGSRCFQRQNVAEVLKQIIHLPFTMDDDGNGEDGDYDDIDDIDDDQRLSSLRRRPSNPGSRW